MGYLGGSVLDLFSTLNLPVANSCLSRDWRVKEPTTMATPTIRFQGRADVDLKRFFRCFAGDKPVRGAEIRRSVSGTIQNQQLMPEQNGFGENRPHPSGTNQTNKDGEDMDE
jgi:hypothetical protein